MSGEAKDRAVAGRRELWPSSPLRHQACLPVQLVAQATAAICMLLYELLAAAGLVSGLMLP